MAEHGIIIAAEHAVRAELAARLPQVRRPAELAAANA
jgi:hypothetical protein